MAVLLFFRWFWQLPQHLFGLITWLIFSRNPAERRTIDGKDYWVYPCRKIWGVSFGDYVFLPRYRQNVTVLHEYGHQVQSRWMGPLYLILIGLPSVSGALIHKWSGFAFNYYCLPWERWADKIMKIDRCTRKRRGRSDRRQS